MKFLLAGASGFLGTALRVRLATEGYEVARLVRRDPASAMEYQWDPKTQQVDPAAFDGVDVVVNLAGAGLADRPWTEGRRAVLLASRVDTTGLLAARLADLAASQTAPALINASGIARYGTGRTETPHTEDSPAGSDFLAQLVLRWEAATEPAVTAGVRVVLLRTAPVLDRSGGAFPPMRLAWSLGLGATLGDGTQRMPMISLTDYLNVVVWAATNPAAAGPYNLTIPIPATNAAFTETLARELHRPRLLRAPAFAVRAPLGELADQLLGDLYAIPHRLTEQGFSFAAPDVAATVRAALGREPSPSPR